MSPGGKAFQKGGRMFGDCNSRRNLTTNAAVPPGTKTRNTAIQSMTSSIHPCRRLHHTCRDECAHAPNRVLLKLLEGPGTECECDDLFGNAAKNFVLNKFCCADESLTELSRTWNQRVVTFLTVGGVTIALAGTVASRPKKK